MLHGTEVQTKAWSKEEGWEKTHHYQGATPTKITHSKLQRPLTLNPETLNPPTFNNVDHQKARLKEPKALAASIPIRLLLDPLQRAALKLLGLDTATARYHCYYYYYYYYYYDDDDDDYYRSMYENTMGYDNTEFGNRNMAT